MENEPYRLSKLSQRVRRVEDDKHVNRLRQTKFLTLKKIIYLHMLHCSVRTNVFLYRGYRSQSRRKKKKA